MISLETAKKLKEAGLQWEHKNGDWFYWRESLGVYTLSMDTLWVEKNNEVVFAPRLDQMLAEIDKLGYAYRVTGKWGKEPYKITVIKEKPLLDFNSWGYSPEEATAQALIWILEQEVTL